jgi:hypothetical protein
MLFEWWGSPRFAGSCVSRVTCVFVHGVKRTKPTPRHTTTTTTTTRSRLCVCVCVCVRVRTRSYLVLVVSHAIMSAKPAAAGALKCPASTSACSSTPSSSSTATSAVAEAETTPPPTPATSSGSQTPHHLIVTPVPATVESDAATAAEADGAIVEPAVNEHARLLMRLVAQAIADCVAQKARKQEAFDLPVVDLSGYESVTSLRRLQGMPGICTLLELCEEAGLSAQLGHNPASGDMSLSLTVPSLSLREFCAHFCLTDVETPLPSAHEGRLCLCTLLCTWCVHVVCTCTCTCTCTCVCVCVRVRVCVCVCLYVNIYERERSACLR